MTGPNGWRAEFARVTKLLSLRGQEQTVLEVASAYGVPVGLLPEPVRFEGGPLDGTIRFGTPAFDSFIATFHEYSTNADHDWEADQGGLVDQGLKDVTYVLEDGRFVCVSVRPSPGGGYVVEDQGWAKVIEEVVRAYLVPLQFSSSTVCTWSSVVSRRGIGTGSRSAILGGPKVGGSSASERSQSLGSRLRIGRPLGLWRALPWHRLRGMDMWTR